MENGRHDCVNVGGPQQVGTRTDALVENLAANILPHHSPSTAYILDEALLDHVLRNSLLHCEKYPTSLPTSFFLCLEISIIRCRVKSYCYWCVGSLTLASLLHFTNFSAIGRNVAQGPGRIINGNKFSGLWQHGMNLVDFFNSCTNWWYPLHNHLLGCLLLTPKSVDAWKKNLLRQ